MERGPVDPSCSWWASRVAERKKDSVTTRWVIFTQQSKCAHTHLEELRAAGEVVQPSESQASEQGANVLGKEEEIVDEVFGQSGELLAQHRILCADTHRAGVEVALSHHGAAQGDEGRRRHGEFIGTQEGSNHHVSGYRWEGGGEDGKSINVKGRK